MELIVIFGIAASLAMDAFSVCVAAGVKIKNPTPRHYFRLSYHFGLFQFLMPLAGYYAATIAGWYLKRCDHWIAFALLTFIGIRMMRESFTNETIDNHQEMKDPSRGMTLVMLSIATSIDAAAVGLSFAVLDIPIVLPAAVIGVVCALFSATGLYIGNKIGSTIGKWAERAGGLILVGIGIKILVEHLCGT